MFHLRHGGTTNDRRLDRIFEHDERNFRFLARDLLTDAQKLAPRSNTWHVGVWLDQGEDGACVGFGYAHDLAADPVDVRFITNQVAKEEIYWEVQKRDPWPGGEYPGASPQYQGTSVLTGAKYLTSLGAYTRYHWARSEEELALYVGWKGPAILGLEWTTDMMQPDSHGFIHPTGQVEGGHCILAKGINLHGGYYTLHNSWGYEWGNAGTCRISREAMADRLANNGEACCPDGRKMISF